MNTCYIKCKRNVTLHAYDIYAILIPPPQTLRQAPYSIDGQIYYTLCAWCMLACVCVCMVGDKFDDSPAVCHVFNDQVFIRSAV